MLPGRIASSRSRGMKVQSTNRSTPVKRRNVHWPRHLTPTSARMRRKKAEAARTGSDTLPASVIDNSLAVDAACSGNPGPMEYRGVHVASRQEIFHFGPMKGTNNIGEFLAIVHGLALLKQKGFDMPIYSDSVNAISWVRQKKCKTKLPRNEETEELFKVIERAEKWLRENTYTTRILKWETKVWGEIPADFGRK